MIGSKHALPVEDRERIADALVAVAKLLAGGRVTADAAVAVEHIRTPLLALYSRYCASDKDRLGRAVTKLISENTGTR